MRLLGNVQYYGVTYKEAEFHENRWCFENMSGELLPFLNRERVMFPACNYPLAQSGT